MMEARHHCAHVKRFTRKLTATGQLGNERGPIGGPSVMLPLGPTLLRAGAAGCIIRNPTPLRFKTNKIPFVCTASRNGDYYYYI